MLTEELMNEEVRSGRKVCACLSLQNIEFETRVVPSSVVRNNAVISADARTHSVLVWILLSFLEKRTGRVPSFICQQSQQSN